MFVKQQVLALRKSGIQAMLVCQISQPFLYLKLHPINVILLKQWQNFCSIWKLSETYWDYLSKSTRLCKLSHKALSGTSLCTWRGALRRHLAFLLSRCLSLRVSVFTNHGWRRSYRYRFIRYGRWIWAWGRWPGKIKQTFIAKRDVKLW